MAEKIELYKGANGEFCWRLVASNGQTIATHGESYKLKDNTEAGIEPFKKNAPTAVIE